MRRSFGKLGHYSAAAWSTAGMNEKCPARLAELQAQITADHEITVAEIAQGLRRAAAGAEAGGNWSE